MMGFSEVSIVLTFLSTYGFHGGLGDAYASNCSAKLREFSCGDTADTCLHQRFWCDGKVECPNGHDESRNICSNPSFLFEKEFGSLPRKQMFYMHQCFFHPESLPKACSCNYAVTVNCDEAGLTSVPSNIQPAKLLRKLILIKNKIATLPSGAFSMYPNLSEIVVSGNRLRSVDVGAFNGLVNLTYLFLDDNELTELQPETFSNVPKLRNLFLTDNKLTDWDPEVFKGNHSIRWLDLRKNKLQLAKPDMFKYLGPTVMQLELDSNLITELTNETLKYFTTKLWALSLARNKISTLNDDIFAHLNLSELILSSNEITSFPPRLFSGLRHLRDLHLAGNKVRYIPENLFDGLEHLRELNLSGFEIDNISKRMFGDPLLKLDHIQFEKFFYCGYTPRIQDCSPKTDGISTAENLLDSVYLKIFGWIIGLLAVIVNSFVLGARCYLWRGSSHISKLHSLCISTLAVSDLMMGIYMITISITDSVYKDRYYTVSHHWIHSPVCRFSGFISVVSAEVSTLLLVFMAIERYNRLIWTPISRSNRADLRITCGWLGVCWLAGVSTAGIPLVAQLDTDGVQVFYGQNGVCLPLFIHDPYLKGWEISALIFIGTPITAMVIITFCYISIFLHVQQSREASDRNKDRSPKADKSHLRKVLAITLSNNVSWITIIITKILALSMVPIPETAYAWMAVFALPVNCCLNPIIYTVLTPEFRSMVRTCSQRRSRFSKAEANALRQIVSYLTFTQMSRGTGSVRLLPHRCSSGGSLSNSLRYSHSHHNSLIAFSRQSSTQADGVNHGGHRTTIRRSSRRRSTSVSLHFPLTTAITTATTSLVKAEDVVRSSNNNNVSLDMEEDEGIVVIANSNDSSSITPSKWDC
ncbi:Relaxin receptor 1 [Hypsibius exemplaris]|uniref:Relaxin receptor 1 n=1 Tax=Hypsibius exemplaris TaxID=2072580 RepID=A0A1W0X1I2_HYPEX|nr:Relaxin receptor 1 [Hypsibius exemplaris]